MNKKQLASVAIAICLVGCMSSCGNTVSQDAYGLVGNTVVKSVVTANDGKVTDIKFDETFLPSSWARLNKTKLDADGVEIDTIKVTASATGLAEDIYLPSSIKVGGYQYVGTRNSDQDSIGEYVDYNLVDTTNGPTLEAEYSLYTYLGMYDASYIGAYAGWYFTCMTNKNVSILDKSGNDILVSNNAFSSTYLSNYAGSFIKGDEAYSGSDKNTWGTNLDYFSVFNGDVLYSTFKNDVRMVSDNGKWKITVYSKDVDPDDDPDGYKYQKTVEIPTTFSDFRSYYTIAGSSFAYIEFSSYGAY